MEYVVMEYFECGSIAAFLKRKNYLTEKDLKEIASCCLIAMSALRSKELIHGVNEGMIDDGIEHQTEQSVLLGGGCDQTE